MSTTSQARSVAIGAVDREKTHQGTDWRVFVLSAVPLLAFVILSLLDIDMMSTAVNAAFAWSANTFGAYWQLLLLATFVAIAASRSGAARLGNTRETDSRIFQWTRWSCHLRCGRRRGSRGRWPASRVSSGPTRSSSRRVRR